MAFIVTMQVLAEGLLSQPDVQVTEVDGEMGVAVSVTGVPVAKINAQVCEQLMPKGLLTTVPVPAPKLTVRLGPVGPVPVKHTTLAVMKPVCIPP